MNHHVLRADLLPHTEQVVFTKARFFGNVKRCVVDIKDLEKVTEAVLPCRLHSRAELIAFL